MTTLLSRRVLTQKLLGGTVVSIRADGHHWWPPSASSDTPTKPAGSNYIHSVWGDTSKLTAPRALINPLIVTDTHQGQPRAGISQSGPAGQRMTATWQAFDPNARSTALRNQYGEHKVWRVTIDGNGGDVWWNGNAGHNMNYGVLFRNCRTVRITGISCVIDDVRTMTGGWPDDGGNTGGGAQMIHFDGSNRPDCHVFVEGCNFDMNHGGPGTNYQHYRTDVMSCSYMGHREIFGPCITVLQNCRFTRVGSLTYGPTHTDVYHFQGGGDSARQGMYMDYFHLENVFVSATYQTFQNNYLIYTNEHPAGGSKNLGQGAPNKQRMHHRWYRCQFHQLQNRAGFITISDGQAESAKWLARLPSMDIEQMYCALQLSTEGYTSGAFYPNNLLTSTGMDKFPTPQWNPDYVDARTDVLRYDGTTQSAMLNVDGTYRCNELHLYNEATPADFPVREFVPMDKVGDGYATIWDADGGLVAEV